MKLTAIAATAIVLLTGCASRSTELLSVSMDHDSAGHYSNVYVMAISDNPELRKSVEESLVARITEAGGKAVISSTDLPGKLASMNKDELRTRAEKAVGAAGADAVLVASVLKDETRDEYVLPRVSQSPVPSSPVHMGLGPYVGYQQDTVIAPGYFSRQREVYVQTSLFDTGSQKPVWRAQSRTINPSDIDSSISEFSDLVVTRLLHDGMLATAKPAPMHGGNY